MSNKRQQTQLPPIDITNFTLPSNDREWITLLQMPNNPNQPLQVDLEVMNADWNKAVNMTVSGEWNDRCGRCMSFEQNCKRDSTCKAANKSMIRRRLQSNVPFSPHLADLRVNRIIVMLLDAGRSPNDIKFSIPRFSLF